MNFLKKVLLAVALALVALAALIEACGDDNSMTACELTEEMAFNGRRPRGQAEREKAKRTMASVTEIGCPVPEWGGDRRAMRQGTSEQPIPDGIMIHDLI